MPSPPLIPALVRRLDALPGTFVSRGVVGSILVLVAGLVTNPLPPGPLRIAVQPLQWLGSTWAGSPAGFLLVVIGMTLLTHSWAALVARQRGPDVAARVREIRQVSARWIAPLLLAPPMFSHDGWSYVAQGALAQAGRDPYVISPGEMPELLTSMVDPIWRYTPTPYGPLPITWGALCAEVTKDPTPLFLLQRVPVLIGLALTAWAVPRLTQRLRVDAGLASALALCSPFMLAHGVGGLHNDTLVMGFVACALVFADRRRWVLASAVVGLAAAVKFTAVIAVVPIVLVSLAAGVTLRGRLCRLALGGMTAGAVVLVCGLPYGLGVGWVKALSVPGVVNTAASIPTAIGLPLQWVFDALGSPAAGFVLIIARSLGMALAVAFVLVLALTRPTGELASALLTTVAVFAAVILLAPVVQTWYALTLVPVAAVMMPHLGRRRLAMVLGSLGGFTALWDASLAGASVLVGGVVAVLWLRRQRSRPPIHTESRPTTT